MNIDGNYFPLLKFGEFLDVDQLVHVFDLVDVELAACVGVGVGDSVLAAGFQAF